MGRDRSGGRGLVNEHVQAEKAAPKTLPRPEARRRQQPREATAATAGGTPSVIATVGAIVARCEAYDAVVACDVDGAAAPVAFELKCEIRGLRVAYDVLRGRGGPVACGDGLDAADAESAVFGDGVGLGFGTGARCASTRRWRW